LTSRSTSVLQPEIVTLLERQGAGQLAGGHR
jgi:hypothetical protein